MLDRPRSPVKDADLHERARLVELRDVLQKALTIVDDLLVTKCPVEPDDGGDRLLGCKEAASVLGTSPATFYRLVASEPAALGMCRVGGRIMVSARMLAAYAARQA
jgi:hypothetical protein